MKGRLNRLQPPDEVRGRNRDTTTADLREALARLQRTEVAPTIAALAREVGVTPALIHNRYADIAKEVRRLSGREPGANEASLKVALKREQETARDLRAENLDLRQQLQAMASVNEALRQEIRVLHATGDAKVVSLMPRVPKR
jgi:predicted transcriptional regulator